MERNGPMVKDGALPNPKVSKLWTMARIMTVVSCAACEIAREQEPNLKNVLKHCSVLIPPDFRFPRYGGFEKCIMKILCTNNIQIFWIRSLICYCFLLLIILPRILGGILPNTNAYVGKDLVNAF